MSGGPQESLSTELRRRGLAAPARLLLEAHRPLRPLLADIVTFLAPLGRPLVGSRAIEMDRLLDDPDAYERLIDDLDDPGRPGGETRA